MARLRTLLSAVSLFITVLICPPTSLAAPKSCAENMNDIYKEVERYELIDYAAKLEKKASQKTQEYLTDTLPAFKAACPAEAKSIKDLENGRYVNKLAAEREKRIKAERRVKASVKDPFPYMDAEDTDLEDLEVQR